MTRRKLQELNLLDDFLFETIVGHPRWGEPFCRILLEIIFQRKLGSLKVVPQKVYGGKDIGLHGARLDVYVEEEPKEGTYRASVYDMEPDQKRMSPAEISRRTRYYHALMDRECLESGEEYERLKNVIVIFILSDDPFGMRRMVYTICNMCREVPELPYDDGARTLFLYTKGTEGEPPETLRQLLHYMEDGTEENAVNPELKELHRMVEAVKENREVERSYMKSWEREAEIRKEERAKERLNTERERQRAEREKQKAEQEKQRAERAEREKQQAEAKIRELEEKVRRYEQGLV